MDSKKRIITRTGDLNVVHDKHLRRSDLYHSLLSISWSRFFGLVGMSYITINLIFALGYFLCGIEALEGVRRDSPLLHFADCFFFSVQTLATIGYGRMSPVGIIPNMLVALEALTGLLSLAVVTGLVFSRFSRPTARVVFSKHALVGTHDGNPALVFRIANERMNQIVEAHLSVVMIKSLTTKEGQRFRSIQDMKLLRNQTPMFSLMWTVIHPIDMESPLYGKTKEELLKDESEILAFLTGMDETFSQNIHARFSYTPEDLVWNQRFRDMISTDEDGRTRVELDRIHELEA